MLTAVDLNGNKVFIDNVSPTSVFFCPICQQKLIQKRKGEMRRPHFAHLGMKDLHYVPCTDRWHYDKTKWHFDWQLLFSIDNYEVVINDKGKRHIADVLINNTVIEFQHSSISYGEFKERNDFYSAKGYEIVWVFDLQKEYNDKRIHRNIWKDDGYVWSYVKKPFKQMVLEDANIKMFLQFHSADNRQTPILEYLTCANHGFSRFDTDQDNILSIDQFVDLVSNGELSKKFSHTAFTVDVETEECISDDKNDQFELEEEKEKEKETESFFGIKLALSGEDYHFPPKPNNPPDPNGKTVKQLWEMSFQSMVVQNTVNMDTLLIKGDAGEIVTDWRGRILGTYTNTRWYGSKPTYRYSPKTYIVKDADSPVWKLIYAKKATEKSIETKAQEPIHKKEHEALNKQEDYMETIARKIRQLLYNNDENSPEKGTVKSENSEQKYERQFNEVKNIINQQEKVAFDSDGGRWVKCRICGEVKPATEFISYGGKGELNLGKCKCCGVRLTH